MIITKNGNNNNTNKKMEKARNDWNWLETNGNNCKSAKNGLTWL